MSDKTEIKTLAEQPVAKKASAFSLDALRKNCTELFGVTESTFVGATCKLKGKEYTVEAMQNIVKAWLDTPVFSKKKEGK